MHAEKLILSHQAIVTEKLQQLNLNISEYSFANLYLFREVHQYEILFDQEIFIRGITRDKHSFLMLMNSPAQIDFNRMTTLLAEVNFLFPIPAEWLHFFDPSLFRSTFLEQDDDYLVSLQKMRTYPGRHLSSKRNFVTQFLSLYNSSIFSLTKEYVQDALSVLDKWQEEYTQDDDQADYDSCKEALQLLDQLKLSGLIIYVQDQPAAFLLGQKLNSQTYVIHFSKARKDIKGIYPYIYQVLANSLDPSLQFLNLEQDLGIPDLRKSKQSYQPDLMLHKHRVSFNNDPRA